jgi:hypothetical protein
MFQIMASLFISESITYAFHFMIKVQILKKHKQIFAATFFMPCFPFFKKRESFRITKTNIFAALCWEPVFVLTCQS